MEPTSPTAGGIGSPKAQCMDASKEISQCYIDVPFAQSAIHNNFVLLLFVFIYISTIYY